MTSDVAQGDYVNALRAFEDAHRLLETGRGEHFATCLASLGAVKQACGKYDEAISHYDEALSVYRASVGNQHVRMSNCCKWRRE